MRTRRSKSTQPRLPRDAERLVALAHAMGASGSRTEDDFWEQRVVPEVERLLDAGADGTIDAALDATFPAQSAYEALIDKIETASEALVIDHDGAPMQALLVAAPVLAWSKYAIPSGALRSEVSSALQVQLQAHVAAHDARVAMAPVLYSIDQLPAGFASVRALTRKLAMQVLTDKAAPGPGKLPETAPILADTRYLLAVLVAPRGAALFRWQELEAGKVLQNREETLAAWRTQGQPNLAPAMSGCVLELLLPDGFHASCREGDRLIRPYSVPAALSLIEGAMQTLPADLRAVVAPFGGEGVEEYRVGFCPKHGDVVHGLIWPLYGSEQGPEPGGPLEQIEDLLRKHGLTDIVMLDELFPMEFCDDCGAPLYADAQGELVHAEMPEGADAPKAHLH